jgi:membrane-associated phospholipid phosphatase
LSLSGLEKANERLAWSRSVNEILEWGYDFIQWWQQFSPALDVPFKTITTLGAEQAFLLLLPLVFWCVDKRQGARLGVLLVLSVYLNYGLKIFFDQPRPSATRVQVLAAETSPGLPSNHSQSGVTIYGFLAAQVRRPQAWIVAGLVALSVGLSRVYLGVHFPSDVLVGWLVGVVVLTLFVQVTPKVERHLRDWSWSRKMVLAITVPLLLFLIQVNEINARLVGVLLGMLAGALIEWRWVRFSAGGAFRQRASRFVVGAIVLVALWLGTRMVSPDEPETLAILLRLFRYTLVGVWASLGAPWLFVRLGLAFRESETPAQF